MLRYHSLRMAVLPPKQKLPREKQQYRLRRTPTPCTMWGWCMITRSTPASIIRSITRVWLGLCLGSYSLPPW